ncbi:MULTISPECIES: hypothetical protein [unclassified Bradyrhizobium]|uniref:hypothetical protein n=1 Tax=unclassified Bradyrhizobium TaxID=2631580 RepID=UPI001FFA1AD3|nr:MULTISPECIES: hypothetical protein [unclassified Bradyrhizobium]MCK1309878.1 hypothetical protein [Bradyrhizobium sp. 45]MCK1435373.1 hypothetical protein [Bradyrhizobium sp. 15]MCK1614924.1 hypothetical protein [Bradyrhizobium sp. 163]MCK1760234.1 hypothetical protein [Bradyrhizobium sp. 136]
MRKPARHETATCLAGAPVKITLGEMRAAGVRGLIVFCLHNASHNVIWAAISSTSSLTR